jgi:hypothetical protein
MSQSIILKAKGLITSTNQLGVEAPEGTLAIANNVVIDNDSVIASRRGFQRTSSTLTSINNRVDTLTSYQDKLIGRRSDDNIMFYDNGSGYTDYAGSYSHPDVDFARMKFAQMNNNLYFTTSSGVQMLDNYAGPIYTTGTPKGLDGIASLSGASGFLLTNTQAAYRIVFGSRDVNNNLYLGSPSQRIIISNESGGSRDISLTFTIPSGVSTADFYQVYRSGMSASSTSEPNDELQLVYEANPTAGQITALSVTLTDNTPDSLKGAYLYTNANQEGIAESNDIPPYSKDICFFKNYMFYAGIKTKHSTTVKLLACGGTSGLALNDTITIDSMVFTAKAATTVANKEFALATAGSASQNIDATAKELVKVINQYTGNTTIYAYYISGYTDLPGAIFIEKRLVTASSFSLAISRLTCWTLTASGVSSNNDYPHGYMWSKKQAPEHVPASHLEFAGNKAYPIRRIIALRDSLFILKDDGVWRLTGQGGQWRLDPLDTSTKILAPESAVVLNNQIYALTDQGVVSISDTGVQVLSRNIEDKLNAIIGVNYAGLRKLSFGIAYETDRKFILYTVNSAADTFPTQAFIYNTFTNTWTMWDKPAKTGFINKADNLLYITKPDEKYILKERKTFNFRDYVDEEVADGFTITAFTGTSVTLNSVTGVSVGDLLYQSSTINSVIIAIDAANNRVTINDSKTWILTAVSIYKGISCTIQWASQHMGNAGVDKHFQEATLLYKKQSFISSTLAFYTDISGGNAASTLIGSAVTGSYGSSTWGSGLVGSGLWGGITRSKPIRCFIPRDKARGTLLTVTYAWRQSYSEVEIEGVSIQFAMISERANRS